MKKISFDHNGPMLWINVEMRGLYFISYTYQLWSASTNTPPVLTNPLKQGNNDIPHDDFHPVINDYNPTEPIANYINRTIDVRFWIKKAGSEDEGFHVLVTVLQGSTFQSAEVIGSADIKGKLGEASLKEEFIILKLV